jgi:hypothetical protein
MLLPHTTSHSFLVVVGGVVKSAHRLRPRADAYAILGQGRVAEVPLPIREAARLVGQVFND